MTLIEISADCNKVVIDFEFLTGGLAGGYVTTYHDDTQIKSLSMDIPIDKIFEFQNYLETLNFKFFRAGSGGRTHYSDYRR